MILDPTGDERHKHHTSGELSSLRHGSRGSYTASAPPAFPASPYPTDFDLAPELAMPSTAPSDVNTLIVCKVGESSAEVAKELSSLPASPGKDSLLVAAFFRGAGSGPLLPATAWRAWPEVKLLGRCGLQTDGFADAVTKVLMEPVPHTTFERNFAFAKAN